MTFEKGKVVSGRILRVTPEGITVALSEGGSGFIATEKLPSKDDITSRFRLNDDIVVRIIGEGNDGQPLLEPTGSEAEVENADAFDREFHRLKDVLKNNPPRTAPRISPQHNRSVEDAIKAWIKRVEGALPQFQKRRSKRLRAAFNDREKHGGRYGKRRHSH